MQRRGILPWSWTLLSNEDPAAGWTLKLKNGFFDNDLLKTWAVTFMFSCGPAPFPTPGDAASAAAADLRAVKVAPGD
jgi:hypothetical protein